MPSIERSFYLLNTRTVLFFSIIERSVLMALVFYCKGMLENITMQRTQQFATFVRYGTNPAKCNACAVAQKIETDCFCRNLPISNDVVVRISRNLANNSSDVSRKIWILTKAIFNNTEIDLRRITKIAPVKILLE